LNTANILYRNKLKIKRFLLSILVRSDMHIKL
jgi:hypothetical protein